LTLVQVVRVPLLPDMVDDEVADVLYNTVLAKIVKSRAWMKQTGTLPHDFIIFCWLPPVGAYEACLEQTEVLLWTEALVWNVRSGGWPFSLVIDVPTDPGSVFPSRFGRTAAQNKKNYLQALSFVLNVEDFADDGREDAMQWYLFEEDVEDENAGGTLTDDASWDVYALVVRLIHLIEHGGEERDRVLIMPDMRGPLPEDLTNYHHAGAPLDIPGLFQFPVSHVCRGARDSDPDVPIEALPWWDLGRGWRRQVPLRNAEHLIGDGPFSDTWAATSRVHERDVVPVIEDRRRMSSAAKPREAASMADSPCAEPSHLVSL